ncbi:MAG: LytTR family DNA-binding domain-containing protein [Allosphingosinicella sp.]|uniref:LytTR family DNA-binding domain-containing protein n=1 Tax=Allosphingosinicella sp. TaxID=2823234 RepID=UPI003951146E
MTSGWVRLTNGRWRESAFARGAVAWLAFGAFGAVNMVVNAASVIDERAQVGRPVAAWEPWTWEATSLAAWLMLAPLVFLAARRLRPPSLSWPAALAAHLALTLLVSVLHVAAMMGMREAVYWAAGADYVGFARFGEVMLYEYRKDAVTYGAAAIFYLLIDRTLRPDRPETGAGEPYRIEVRDGSRTRWLAPEDVDWAQAAGNYVELHGRFGTLLHRRTLAALEAELEPRGFVRIHRSRLVRRSAVAGIETRPSGDFEAALTGGERIGGSRRFRDRLS